MIHRTSISAIAVALTALSTVPVSVDAQVVWANVRTSERIEGIDHQAREVTLRGSQGTLTEHSVPETFADFAELEVGDEITVTFLHELGLHLRRPGSQAPDLTRLTAASGGASVMRTMETEVSQIDSTVPAISIKSGSGEQATFRLPKGMSLSDFAVGDMIDVTYVLPEVVTVTNN